MYRKFAAVLLALAAGAAQADDARIVVVIGGQEYHQGHRSGAYAHGYRDGYRDGRRDIFWGRFRQHHGYGYGNGYGQDYGRYPRRQEHEHRVLPWHEQRGADWVGRRGR